MTRHDVLQWVALNKEQRRVEIKKKAESVEGIYSSKFTMAPHVPARKRPSENGSIKESIPGKKKRD